MNELTTDKAFDMKVIAIRNTVNTYYKDVFEKSVELGEYFENIKQQPDYKGRFKELINETGVISYNQVSKLIATFKEKDALIELQKGSVDGMFLLPETIDGLAKLAGTIKKDGIEEAKEQLQNPKPPKAKTTKPTKKKPTKKKEEDDFIEGETIGDDDAGSETIESLRAANKKLSDGWDRMFDEHIVFVDEIDALKAENKALKSRNSDLTKMHNSLIRKAEPVDALKAENKALKAENKKLNKEVDKQNASLDAMWAEMREESAPVAPAIALAAIDEILAIAIAPVEVAIKHAGSAVKLGEAITDEVGGAKSTIVKIISNLKHRKEDNSDTAVRVIAAIKNYITKEVA